MSRIVVSSDQIFTLEDTVSVTRPNENGFIILPRGTEISISSNAGIEVTSYSNQENFRMLSWLSLPLFLFVAAIIIFM